MKNELRQQLRQRRKNISKKQRETAERQTQNHLSRFIQRGKRIAIYYPIGSEMKLNNLIKLAKKRKAELYLPYIEPHSLRLWFTPMRENAVAERPRKQNRLHIPQYAGQKIRAHQLHTLIVPLLGINRHGYRLGQGGGFYDCTLAHAQRSRLPRTIGVGFSCQQCDHIPIEPHDKPLNYFASETGLLRFSSKN